MGDRHHTAVLQTPMSPAELEKVWTAVQEQMERDQVAGAIWIRPGMEAYAINQILHFCRQLAPGGF